MAATDPLVDRLRGIVGRSHVLSEPDERAGYEVDWTGRFRGSARAVVRPADTHQVAATLAACHAAGAAVVPQGGNTGLVGGSVPQGGEVVVSLRRLDTVERVARGDEVVAGAGVTLGRLRDALAGTGRDFAVDMASRDSATLGGMVATNAGGLHVLRYGGMREQLLGVEAVRVDGQVVGRVPALHKDNTGYRWEGLLAGSEGTLAVVTRVHLRLVPSLPERVVALCAFDDLDDALACCTQLRLALDSLLALEAFFAPGLALVREHAGLPAPFPDEYAVYLLIECAGRTGSGDELVDSLAAALGDGPAVRATAVARDAPARARLWEYRERHTEAVNALGVPHKLDVTLPFGRLAEFADRVGAAIESVARGAHVVCFGHLGDGNLHVNVVGPAAGDERVDDVVLRLAASMGGSISAEHGIGAQKRHLLTLARSPADVDTMRAVKHAFDPDGLLHPGVLFP